MTPLDQAMLTFETNMVAQALKKVTGCSKINSGALGNIVRQLHVHIVARSEGDPGWPGPVWGYGSREPYRRDDLHQFCRSTSRRRYSIAAIHLTYGPNDICAFRRALARAQPVCRLRRQHDRPAVGKAQRRFDAKGARRSGRAADADARRAHPAQVAATAASTPISRSREAAPFAPLPSTRRCCLASRRHGPVLAVPVGRRSGSPAGDDQGDRLPLGQRAGADRCAGARRAGARRGPARLACQPRLLRQMRRADRDAGRRLQAASASTANPSISRAPTRSRSCWR